MQSAYHGESTLRAAALMRRVRFPPKSRRSGHIPRRLGFAGLENLARVYLGPKAVFPPAIRDFPGYVTRITSARFVGVGPWGAKGAD